MPDEGRPDGEGNPGQGGSTRRLGASSGRGRIRRTLRHPVTHNTLALYAVQFGHYLLPLAVFPALARVLTDDSLGIVFFSQAFATLVQTVVEFGFNLSGVRDIARAREHPSHLVRIMADVNGAKLVLAAITLLASVAAAFVVPAFSGHLDYALLAWVSGASTGLNPRWVLVGLERVKASATLELGCRALAVVLIVALVRHSDDVSLVLWIWALTSVLPLVLVARMVSVIVPFGRSTAPGTRQAISSSWSLFVASAGIGLYTTANVFILGLLGPTAQIPLYSGPEKIIRAVGRLSFPLSTAVFPRVSHLAQGGKERRAERLAFISLVLLTAVGAASAIGLAIFAPLLVRLVLGPGYEEAESVLRAMAIMVPVIAATSALMGQWLLAHGQDRSVRRIVLTVGVVNVAVACVVVPFAGAIGLAISVVGAEVLALVLTIATVRRRVPRPSDKSASLPAEPVERADPDDPAEPVERGAVGNPGA